MTNDNNQIPCFILHCNLHAVIFPFCISLSGCCEGGADAGVDQGRQRTHCWRDCFCLVSTVPLDNYITHLKRSKTTVMPIYRRMI